MFGLRSLAYGITAILVGGALAVPVPYMPTVPGEIVHVAPIHTSLGAVPNTPGAYNPHPHVFVGTNQNGQPILHQITHGNHANYGPRMNAAALGHGITGNLLLTQAVANPQHIQASAGHWAGINVAGHLPGIAQARAAQQALVQAHHNAANEHNNAANEHDAAHLAHVNAANQYGVNHPWHAQHLAQANWHLQQAANHRAQETVHRNGANNALSPNPAALAAAHQAAANARHSANGAINSHHHANNSGAHLAAGTAHTNAEHAHASLGRTYRNVANHYAAHGNHVQATHYHGLANQHFAHAQTHQQHAASHLPTNGHHAPNPHTSSASAIASAQNAHHLKNQVPHAFHAH